jgi:hypothetical protein
MSTGLRHLRGLTNGGTSDVGAAALYRSRQFVLSPEEYSVHGLSGDASAMAHAQMQSFKQNAYLSERYRLRDTAFHTAFHTAWLAGGALALGFGSNIYHYAEQRRARALPFFEEDRSKLATLCGAMWEFQSGVMAQGNAETTKTTPQQLRYDRMHDVVLKVRIYGKCRRGS